MFKIARWKRAITSEIGRELEHNSPLIKGAAPKVAEIVM